MIHDMNDDIPPFGDAAHEREWLAQENAMRRERLHLDPRNDDARTQRYRLLARTLRQTPDEGPPSDFARQVATQVAPARRTSHDARFEFGLIIALCLTLLAGSVMVIASYGSQWWRPVAAFSLPEIPSMHLLLALAGCIAFTWLLGHLQSSAEKRGQHGT
jgi:hypothetical protein